MAKLDLKGAYTCIPILKSHRKYMWYLHGDGGKTYQYRTLPFGMGSGPRIFSKLMKPIIETDRGTSGN